MPDKTFYEFHNGYCFFHKCVIFMAVVMEGDKVAIIFINPGGGDHRASEITSDVFYNSFRITFAGFGIHVETFPVFPVAAGLNLFKGWPDPGFHFVKEGGAESIAEESIIEMMDAAPESVVTVAAFGNETMDVGIPFEIPAKGVEDHDKTGSEIHGFV